MFVICTLGNEKSRFRKNPKSVFGSLDLYCTLDHANWTSEKIYFDKLDFALDSTDDYPEAEQQRVFVYLWR